MGLTDALQRTSDVVPSFILMAVKGSKVVTYVYELKGSEVSVSKSEFSKVADASSAKAVWRDWVVDCDRNLPKSPVNGLLVQWK